MNLDIKLTKYSKHSLNISLTWNEISLRIISSLISKYETTIFFEIAHFTI